MDCKKFVSNTRQYQIFFPLFFSFLFKVSRHVQATRKVPDWSILPASGTMQQVWQVYYGYAILNRFYTTYVNIVSVLLLTHRLNSSVKMASMNATLTSCVHTQYCLIIDIAPQQLSTFFNCHYQSGTCPVASPVTMCRHHVSILKRPHKKVYHAHQDPVIVQNCML